MQQQISLLQQVVEGTTMHEEAPLMHKIATAGLEVKLLKISPQDDIKAYLTTFENVMWVYKVEDTRWAQMLAGKIWVQMLTGKAQQAYAAMDPDKVDQYAAVKTTIFKRYDIDEEKYRQLFRSATKKVEETQLEFIVCL